MKINEKIFADNIRLAYKFKEKYKGCGIEDDDLTQICLMALWKAVNTYKKDKRIRIEFIFIRSNAKRSKLLFAKKQKTF